MKKIRRGEAVRVLVALSALSAIGIILGKFLAFNLTEFMRFSLENTTIIFSGIVFGPISGLVVGAVQDLVGCLAVGYTINPIITLGSAMIGGIAGCLFRLTKKLSPTVRIGISVAAAHLLGSVIVKSIGLTIFYSLPFTVTTLWRLLNYAIVGAVEVVLLGFILKSKQMCSQINKITSFSLHDKFKSQDEAKEYARSVSGVFSKPGLERVSKLLASLGNPERELKVVHVTGTNGKGSFVAMLSSILGECGLKVGSFTSPYLYEMRESIRIGGEMIDEESFLSLFERLRPLADAAMDKPTEFELLTAAAYLAFKEARVDVAIVECGMGARRDATNVIEHPLLSVITGISIDHTSYLGESEEAIAAEKAGIIKDGRPVLIGRMGDGARRAIEDEARRHNSYLSEPASPQILSMTLDGTLLRLDGLTEVRLPLLGYHQADNAALAYKAVKIISELIPGDYSEENISAGFEKTVWHGRFEVLSKEPVFVYDGAHNEDGVRVAVRSAEHYFPEGVILLTGVLRDKDYRAMARILSKIAVTVVTVTPDNRRALPSEDYARVFQKHGIEALPSESVEAGVALACEQAKKSGLPVLCLGSLYIYSDVTKALKNAEKH